MSRRYARVVVLCEDAQHHWFARHFLEGCGITEREIQWSQASKKSLHPVGKHVRREFPTELKKYREELHRNDGSLIVIIDGDQGGVDKRFQDFAEECSQRKVPFRTVDERVVILVPTRNIETWLKYLDGVEVNQHTKYPKELKGHEQDCLPQVQALRKMCDAGPLRKGAPECLKAACSEYRARLEPALKKGAMS